MSKLRVSILTIVAALFSFGMGGASHAGAANDKGIEAIFANLQEQKSSFKVTLPVSSANQVTSLIKAAMVKDDYIRYIIRSWEVETRTSASSTQATIKIEYSETKAQTDFVKAQVAVILKSILTKDMNVFEREKAIHDYIVSTIAYDTSLTNHSAYSALKTGKTVCQGFSLLAYRMLTDAGIKNRIVEGSGRGISHAWNKVYLEGNWYNLDTTWDDPIPFEKGRKLYTYFNVTDPQLALDHTWDQKAYPAATADFNKLMKAKMTADPAKASVYKSMLNPQGEALKGREALVAKLQKIVSNKVMETSFPYITSSRNANADLNYALDILNKKSYASISTEISGDFSGLVTITVHAKYR